MCGIVGWLSGGEPPRRHLLQAMTDSLAHRGPDASGIWIDQSVGLGHRRLSIIDTGETANQPLEDVDGAAVIVFNGEIYNYRELRADLERLGHRFRTRSDTEVMLEAYKRWGTGCLDRFNGMFAFALWDRKARRLFVARDRAGEKPLFYARTRDGLVFASEPRALRMHPAVTAAVDLVGLSKYLSMNYVPGEGTLLQGVRKLPPAHYMMLAPGAEPEIRPYWSLAPHFHDKSRWASEAEAAEALTALIDDATRMRTVSDVPLGAFLSSGIDSASVVAAMARASDKVRTYSVGFSHADFDEVDEARATARHLGVDHSDRVLDLDVGGMIRSMVHAADEPLADNSSLPTWFLCRFAREKVTVALSGDGGDEAFAGYETYVADRLGRACAKTPDWVWRGARTLMDRALPVSHGKVGWDYKVRAFLDGAHLGWPRMHFAWRGIFAGDERRRLLKPDVTQAVGETDVYADFAALQAEVADAHPLDQALYVDTRTWLVDDVLVKTDRMSMAHGLEVRAPLLDHRILELAASLPPQWKLNGRRKKHILKESQRARLPAAVIARKKIGFNAPMSHWLKGPLRSFARDCLASAGLDAWLVRGEVERLWAEHEAGARENGYKLFGLVSLSLWLDGMRQRRVENAASPLNSPVQAAT
jgi:asparagine synthase (glutamine-hydrolysing)